ncbi:hypothetical protein GE061_005250 [Apolygus lucorum]|uniref:Uncharacterized protein n=1 Tax=Apolygus lucorum TaxID=248454 RepID=A0A6A4J564_APOLU|nr:hypothetical protein GE061_005250 [Apolygus lucorum]
MRILLLSFLIFNGGVLGRASNRRVKRVIDGEVLDEEMNSPYGVLKYFVVIGNGHNCDISLPDGLAEFFGLPNTWGISIPTLGFVCRPKPHHLQCTGSLLTSFIVQTACHCVAEFDVKPNGTEFPVTKNVFENRFDIFPGNLKVEDIPSGAAPNRYLTHPKCYKDSNWKTMLHDYALIVLKTSFDDFRTTPAPVYPERDLVRLWTELQAKRKICLTIGFGSFKKEDNSASPILLHGWFRAWDYISCFR